MDRLLELASSPAAQSHAVLALTGITSAYVALARPTLSRRRRGRPAPASSSASCPAAAAAGADASGADASGTSPAATLAEAGTSAAVSTGALLAFRAVMAIYIVAMGARQMARVGPYVFKFYTIWNWWLLGLYFALAATASFICSRVEAQAAAAAAARATAPPATAPPAGETDAPTPHPRPQRSQQPLQQPQQPPPQLLRSTGLSRACHALFLVNTATVIIVDVVCWAVLYPMLARGPQTPEIQRMIQRLLLTFTSYNQHGLNALYIFTDLFLNRHRFAFHAVGPIGLWSLLFALWSHVWHYKTGKWLYPFLDTSKSWAPAAYFGLYVVHWLAFGLVGLLYGVKAALYGRVERRRAARRLKAE
ncbi:hypothetical protein TSOC_007187 [Tetrabaena socialis]|uniref:Uncharacterized protein n=1 Tax=Tetrabaena socialis TaxID=47790 RepID=A0A2J8A1N7_9CHLO|nr:hypothetical protein TSOC_007187 [Tetrabaena socialis]|eukprot:PNH06424.1 hypothetical protein TSOC_007187 [Tetrabaena socialis]